MRINRYLFFIGLRYFLVKRKDHFVSFISTVSMLGIALGVAVLITVLSVMNGFSKEIRAKILSITPHITLKSFSGTLNSWQVIVDDLKKVNLPFFPKRAGWYYQQLLKLAISNVENISENYVVLDADTIILKKINCFCNKIFSHFNRFIQKKDYTFLNLLDNVKFYLKLSQQSLMLIQAV